MQRLLLSYWVCLAVLWYVNTTFTGLRIWSSVLMVLLTWLQSLYLQGSVTVVRFIETTYEELRNRHVRVVSQIEERVLTQSDPIIQITKGDADGNNSEYNTSQLPISTGSAIATSAPSKPVDDNVTSERFCITSADDTVQPAEPSRRSPDEGPSASTTFPAPEHVSGSEYSSVPPVATTLVPNNSEEVNDVTGMDEFDGFVNVT
eukprot:gene30413-39189_t